MGSPGQRGLEGEPGQGISGEKVNLSFYEWKRSRGLNSRELSCCVSVGRQGGTGTEGSPRVSRPNWTSWCKGL